jgi:hypothetical protein
MFAFVTQDVSGSPGERGEGGGPNYDSFALANGNANPAQTRGIGSSLTLRNHLSNSV